MRVSVGIVLRLLRQVLSRLQSSLQASATISRALHFADDSSTNAICPQNRMG